MATQVFRIDRLVALSVKVEQVMEVQVQVLAAVGMVAVVLHMALVQVALVMYTHQVHIQIIHQVAY